MKTVLWILLGALIMYVLLKILSGSEKGDSQTSARLKELVNTMQFRNLIMTNEAREIVKTPEFRRFIVSAGEDYVKTISKTLAG